MAITSSPNIEANPCEVVSGALKPIMQTERGSLYEGDCLNVLPLVRDSSVDTVFADPPFNLGKEYGKRVDDGRVDRDYLDWCKQWIQECIRILKPGGALVLTTVNTRNPGMWSVRLVPMWLRSRIRGAGYGRELADNAPTFYRANTPRAIRHLLKSSGFVMEREARHKI